MVCLKLGKFGFAHVVEIMKLQLMTVYSIPEEQE